MGKPHFAAGRDQPGIYGIATDSRCAQQITRAQDRHSPVNCYKLAAVRDSMTTRNRPILFAVVTAAAIVASWAQSPTPGSEGKVTAIFHDVQLLPEQAAPKPAAIDDKVDDGTGLRTGDDSRSELTFADLTITRLGSNTIFSFNKAGRSIRLDSGSILVYARKNSGGAQITSKAVSVAITGTTVIFESSAENYDQLTVLEGDARFSLNDYPDQSTEVRGGQLVHVRAGAKKLPKPGHVDLRRILNTNPLITNFPPLPSLDLILAVQNLNRTAIRQPLTSGPPAQTGAPLNAVPPGAVPNPVGQPGPPTSSSYPPVSVPTSTPHHRPTPSPHPTPKPTPTPSRYSPKPTPTPKKRLPPVRRLKPTPTPIRIR
jgi:hypothetical protein